MILGVKGCIMGNFIFIFFLSLIFNVQIKPNMWTISREQTTQSNFTIGLNINQKN